MPRVKAKTKSLDDTLSSLERLRMRAYDYVYNNLGDEAFAPAKRDIEKLIYSRVTKRTGALAESLTLEKNREGKRISVDVTFDHTKAPHVNTHIGYGSIRIRPSNAEWLTVPVGSLATMYDPRPRVRDFPTTLRFIEKRPFWFIDDELAFVGRKEVTIPRRIEDGEIREEAMRNISRVVNTLVSRFIEECLR